MGDSVVLTALGLTTRGDPVPYVFPSGEPYRAKVSTLALLARWSELEPAAPWPDRVLALVTPEAERETWPLFQEQVEQISREQDRVEPSLRALQIPAPTSDGALWEEVEVVQRALEGASDLVVDVTHGFRSLPLIYWAAAYHWRTLSASLTIHHVVYAHLERGREPVEPAPWVDLAPVAALPEWTYAVQAWQRHGRLAPLRNLVRDARRPEDPAARGRFGAALRDLAREWDVGLSLDVGVRARSALEELEALSNLRASDPLASTRLRQQLVETLQPLVARPDVRIKNKQDVVLDRDELIREISVAKAYLQQDGYVTAVGLAREWVVNYVLWCTGQAAQWLDSSVRNRASRQIHGAELRDDVTPGSASARTRNVVRAWKQVRRWRNEVHHQGFMSKQVKVASEELQTQLGNFRVWLADDERFVLPPGSGRVLLTPLGLNPGAMYTVLQEPGIVFDRLVVLATEQSERLVQECLARVPHAPPITRCEVVRVNPFTPSQSSEGKELARKLVDAKEVVVNVTGGTTPMQLRILAIRDELLRWSIPTETWVAVDKRPPDGASRVWVRGEVVKLRSPSSTHDDDE